MSEGTHTNNESRRDDCARSTRRGGGIVSERRTIQPNSRISSRINTTTCCGGIVLDRRVERVDDGSAPARIQPSSASG